MTCAVCPTCGTDLERFEPVHRGDLELLAHEVRWKGEQVPLRPAGKLCVSALVRSNGRPVSLFGLGEAMGCKENSEDSAVLVRMHICHIRRAFRQIDPSFKAIEAVYGVGIRWAGDR